jgi:hypothetical protein
MAFEQPGMMISLEAGADLSAKQYHFVKLNSSGQAVIVSAITDVPVGILQNKPTSGQVAAIMVDGISKVVADGTLDEGNVVGTSADGQADAIAPGTDTTVYAVGQMLTANAAGELGSILFDCKKPARAT